MGRIRLLVNLNPSSIEIFVRLKRNDGVYQRLVATIDTGAAVSLLPSELLNDIDYHPTQRGTIEVDQAGIARQSFHAIEAVVSLILEDQFGAETDEFDVKIWFADTDVKLIGFEDVLDRATLFLDMRETRTGWFEIDA
jgi:hypothetical protein